MLEPSIKLIGEVHRMKKTVATSDEPVAERPASSPSRPSLKRSSAFLDEESVRVPLGFF